LVVFIPWWKQRLKEKGMPRITQELLDRWGEANDGGNGYAVGSECDTPAEAAEAEGWEILARGVERTVLCRQPSGILTLVCNANGPWACDV
jgi:hypothetical protein